MAFCERVEFEPHLPVHSDLACLRNGGDALKIVGPEHGQDFCRMAKQPKDSFGFAAYEEEHSLEALKRVLADALPSWLERTPS